MGYNLISGCHKCKLKVFHFRKEENVKILDFYIKHKECAKENLNNVQTIMDNCDEDWIEDFKQGGYRNDEINNFKPKNIKMKKDIIAAAEARAISEANKSKGIDYIMNIVEEYAAQGKTDFVIRDRVLFKKWDAELISLGYVFKGEYEKVWVLSWEKDYYTKLQEMIKRTLRKERSDGLIGIDKLPLEDLIKLSMEQNIEMKVVYAKGEVQEKINQLWETIKNMPDKKTKEEILIVDKDIFSEFQKMIVNKGVSQANHTENPLKFTDSFLEYVGVNIWAGETILMKLHVYTKK